MRYSQILILSIAQQTAATNGYERTIGESVKNGIVKHFDHVTDLPTTPWYRVPQGVGDDTTYAAFQSKQVQQAQSCDQNLDSLTYATDAMDQSVKTVSSLKWPQSSGSVLRNVYPTYLSINGGVRNFCVLRRYLYKTVRRQYLPDTPRDREWGPYRCAKMQDDGQFQKFISLRSGPYRKYQPILNLVDIRAQPEWFGEMYTKLALDSDTMDPVGKWQNNRPITNFTRNSVLEKYNVLKFYNAEHELFNDNSRFRLVGKELIDIAATKHEGFTGQIQEVDTMMPSYTIITGGPFKSSLFAGENADTWHRRNMVPNYITRSFKGGFMRTGSLIHNIKDDAFYILDNPGFGRPCCTNSAPGYEGYNNADMVKKAVGYMFHPSFAPFFLAQKSSDCKDGTTWCTETYGHMVDLPASFRPPTQWDRRDSHKPDEADNNIAMDDTTMAPLSNFLQLTDPTKQDSPLSYAESHKMAMVAGVDPHKIERNLYYYLYTGNSRDLIEKNYIELYGYGVDDAITKYPIADNLDWPTLDMKMFGKCESKTGTEVKVNYICDAGQYWRNEQEKKDAVAYVSPHDDYMDAWMEVGRHALYRKWVRMHNYRTFASDIFENDPLYRDFEHFAPRFPMIDCTRKVFDPKSWPYKRSDFDATRLPKSRDPLNDDPPSACDFWTIRNDGVDLPYAYNQYFKEGQFKHTIIDIKMDSAECNSIVIDVAADCGKPTNVPAPATSDTVSVEDNYWAYQRRCTKADWDSIYNTMFQEKWKQGDVGSQRSELN